MPRYEKVFAEYQGLITEFEEFLAAVSCPAPQHLRVNTLRTSESEIRASLEALGGELVPEPWCDFVLRVAAAPRAALGTTLEHALGHIYLQSASSAVAALALGAGPGERVLDLCAAPGSKTTLLAQGMGDRGCVLANEPNQRRAKSLQANLGRLGLTCVVVTAYPGQSFPLRHRFHRVLVDAPCSGEGTWRGPRARPRRVKAEFRKYLIRQQAALLRRGYDVLEPGGTLVYSTCTYAPSENEGVLAPFLEETGAEVVPLGLDPGGEPGVREWHGTRFPVELRHARRLYPHRFDSEGFFVVRLVKP